MTEEYRPVDPDVAASEAMEAGPGDPRKKEVTLSSGAVIRAKPVPDNLMLTMRKQNPPPDVPITHVDDPSGKSWDEPNPQHPKYIADLEEYQLNLGDAFMNLTLLAGMDILELPEGVEPFDADGEWLDELEAAGLEMPEKRFERKLLWIRYKIAPNTEDMTLISETYAASAEIDEEEIAAKQKSFRSTAAGDAGGGSGEAS